MPMTIILRVAVHEDLLGLDDLELGRACREILLKEMAVRQAAVDDGRRKQIAHAGVPVVIDGVEYPSRAEAMRKLGISRTEIIKRFGYAHGL